ncbi:PREDICTED: protein starmaker-like [Ipomoea nil]|uniref:protein starmaker-like n=1 Tax=Ipomoea nil TaxID=35883 RepID=UPI00090119C3|nr:PREDICTED: protein starmaker-like [Ipomoea nil]
MKELRVTMRLSKIKTELDKMHQNDRNYSTSGIKNDCSSDKIPEDKNDGKEDSKHQPERKERLDDTQEKKEEDNKEQESESDEKNEEDEDADEEYDDNEEKDGEDEENNDESDQDENNDSDEEDDDSHPDSDESPIIGNTKVEPERTPEPHNNPLENSPQAQNTPSNARNDSCLRSASDDKREASPSTRHDDSGRKEISVQTPYRAEQIEAKSTLLLLSDTLKALSHNVKGQTLNESMTLRSWMTCLLR